jgi:hypothetical protein
LLTAHFNNNSVDKVTFVVPAVVAVDVTGVALVSAATMTPLVVASVVPVLADAVYILLNDN